MQSGLICLIALLLATSALAANHVTGDVSKVDAPKKELSVLAESDCCGRRLIETTYTLSDKTKITLNGKTATLADLKAEDVVDLEFEEVDDVQKVAATRDHSSLK